MATITTDTYLDGGVARTAGENWNINGGNLTIRTDTRWHANAPASMTGVLGAVTMSSALGGSLLIDARNVRWLAYDTGSGTVPAIGTNVTQSGVTSSYLLGVYASLTSAPTAVGAAMPASGFIKFREVDGAFAAGALTGIGASATAADVLGWIEVVQRQAVANSVARLNSYTTRGGWFYLDNTTGAANQTLQIPTNGGGAGTYVPAVWIETGPGTDVFEPWPAILATTMTTTNFSTDARAKFVCGVGNGQVIIGHNGTTAVGFVPPAGCRVRVPNIFGRQSTSAGGDANNQTPHATMSTRPDFSTNGGGYLDFEYFLNDWYLAATGAYTFIARHSATFEFFGLTNIASDIVLDDFAVGSATANATVPITITSCTTSSTLTGVRAFCATSAAGGVAISTSNNISIDDCYFGMLAVKTVYRGAITLTTCNNVVLNNNHLINGIFTASSSTNIEVYDTDYCDSMGGGTATTSGYIAVISTACADVLMDGVTLGFAGNLPGYHNPYTAMFYCSGAANVTFRNAGTVTAPLQTNPAQAPGYLAHDAGNNTNCRWQRIYATSSRTATAIGTNTSINTLIQDVHSNTGAITVNAINATGRGIRQASNATGGSVAVYGTHFMDLFFSDTVGAFLYVFNEPTAETATYVTLSLAGAAGGFTSVGTVAMPTVGDSITIETPYYVLQHTGFTGKSVHYGANPQNFNYFYQIDHGTGTFSAEARLMSVRVRASGGTAGTNTFVFTDTAAALPEIGDFVETTAGTNFADGTYVTNIVGTTVTLSANILVTLTSVNVYFTSGALVAESLSPSTGAKLRIRVETAVASTTNANLFLKLGTSSTLTAQTDNLYPLDYATIILTGYTLGSRIQIKDITNTIELYNDVPTDTTVTVAVPFTSNFDARVRVMYCTDTTANKIVEFTETVTIDGFSRTITPEANQIYIDNAIDGTAITDIVFNDSLFLVEVDSATGLISWGYIYAYETYWLFTEEGIRDAGRIIEAIDVANYVFTGFKVKNVTSGPVVPLIIANGWGRDSVTGETIDIIDTTGGSIFSNPDLVIAYETTGGGGATAADVWSYSTRTLSTGGVTAIQSGIATSAEIAALNNLSAAQVNAEVDTALADYDAPTKAELDTAIGTVTTNQGVINVGVQKASKLIPHSTDL